MPKPTPISRLPMYKSGDEVFHYDLNGMIQAIKANTPQYSKVVASGKQHGVQILANEEIPSYSVFTINFDDLDVQHQGLEWKDYWIDQGIQGGLLAEKVKAHRMLYTNESLEIASEGGGWAVEIPYGVPIQMRSDTALSGPCAVDLNTFQLTDAIAGGFFAIGQSNEPDVYWVIRVRQEPACYVQAPPAGLPLRVNDGPSVTPCEVLMRATVAAGGYSIGDFVLTGIDIDVVNPWFKIAADEGDRLVEVDSHYDGANVIGWDCDNIGTTFQTLV